MLEGKIVAITGAAGGIGKAIAEKSIAAGAKVAISDIDAARIAQTGSEIGADHFVCDVGNEASMQAFISGAQSALGPIDMFVSNAGIGEPDETAHAAAASDESWERSWKINMMANVYAARALLPGWIKRRDGRLVVTSSAAGLLAQIGSGSYTISKHGARAFAEYVAMMHKHDGVKVHCICPQYVKTNMTAHMTEVTSGPDRHIEAADVADALFAAIEKGEFLVLPHPIIGEYYAAKVQNFDRYIGGMANQKKRLYAAQGGLPLGIQEKNEDVNHGTI